MKPQRLTPLAEDFKSELAQIHVDQVRFAKYGTNGVKKAALSSYLLLRLKEPLSLKAFGLKIPGQVTI